MQENVETLERGTHQVIREGKVVRKCIVWEKRREKRERHVHKGTGKNQGKKEKLEKSTLVHFENNEQ